MQLARRMMASRAGGGGVDVAVMPFFAQDGSVALLAFAACMPAAIWQARGEVRKQAKGDVEYVFCAPQSMPVNVTAIKGTLGFCTGLISAVIQKCF